MSDRGLLNDVLFKIVFGTAKSEPVLSALLNALLGYTGEQKIVSLTIENPTLEKEYLSDKGAILDLKAVDRAGRWYNIEVQLQPDMGRENYFKRSLFYWAKLYSGQIEQGHQYVKLAKTISISLLDFNLFSDSPNLHNVYVLKEKSSNTPLLDILELHYIELQKFAHDKPHKLRTSFEKWLYVLKFSPLYSDPDIELPENLQEEEGIQMAIESMQKAYARDEVRELIWAREKARLDYESGLAYAHEQGLEKGREETTFDIARKMLSLHVGLDVVAQTTGLTHEELKKLQAGEH